MDNSYQLNLLLDKSLSTWYNDTQQILAGAIEWVVIYPLDCIILGGSIDFGGTHPMDSNSCLVDSTFEGETTSLKRFI